MICNHEKLLECTEARYVGWKKGSFLYLPGNGEAGHSGRNLGTSKIQFKINKGMFEGNEKYFNDYENRKHEITKNIAKAVMLNFQEKGLLITAEDDRIDVDYSRLEQTDKLARMLIDVVEFVKTCFLAIA